MKITADIINKHGLKSDEYKKILNLIDNKNWQNDFNFLDQDNQNSNLEFDHIAISVEHSTLLSSVLFYKSLFECEKIFGLEKEETMKRNEQFMTWHMYENDFYSYTQG